MSFPAYEGIQFYFSITVGSPWRQEFRAEDRGAPLGMIFNASVWDGFDAKMTLTSEAGALLATLTSAPGGDGTIHLGPSDLGPSAVVCELPATVTSGFAPTTNFSRTSTKAFVLATFSMTDPARPAEPYIFAVGKGVIVPIST